MRTFTRRALCAAFLTVGFGCGSTEPGPSLPGPATIAVLPFQGEARSLAQRDVIRRMLDAFLQGRGVLTADLDWLDRQLMGIGVDPSEDASLPDPALVAAELGPLGFTYVLRGVNFNLSKANAGVAFLDQVSGRLELYDLRRRETVWRSEASSLEYGGILLESSQVVTGVRQSFDRNTNGQELRLGIAFCQDALEEWPGFGDSDQLVRTSEPTVTAVRIREMEASESAPARRTIEVLGTSDCIAHVRLPDGRQHPMLEIESSRYRAHFELIDQETLTRSELVLTDRWGLQLRRSIGTWLEGESGGSPDTEGSP